MDQEDGGGQQCCSRCCTAPSEYRRARLPGNWFPVSAASLFTNDLWQVLHWSYSLHTPVPTDFYASLLSLPSPPLPFLPFLSTPPLPSPPLLSPPLSSLSFPPLPSPPLPSPPLPFRSVALRPELLPPGGQLAPADCDMYYGEGLLTEHQYHICLEDRHILAAIARGLRRAVYLCQEDFKDMRWNCTAFTGKFLLGRAIASIGKPTRMLPHTHVFTTQCLLKYTYICVCMHSKMNGLTERFKLLIFFRC